MTLLHRYKQALSCKVSQFALKLIQQSYGAQVNATDSKYATSLLETWIFIYRNCLTVSFNVSPDTILEMKLQT